MAAIAETNESRKKWLLDKLELKGRINPKIKNYQFWQAGFHPYELVSNTFIEQKLNYIYNNPVEAGYVVKSEDYLYSSAIDYAGGKRTVGRNHFGVERIINPLLRNPNCNSGLAPASLLHLQKRQDIYHYR